MNQEKTGAFIAQLRKESNMPQVQLADELGVTNKAISKWENGKSLPDVQLFQPICKLFHISVNELLAGEHIQQEEIQYKTEHMLLEYVLLTKNIWKLSLISFLLIGIGSLICFLPFMVNRTDTVIRIFGCSIGAIIILFGVYMNFIVKIYMNTNRVYNYMNEKFGHMKVFISGIIMVLVSINMFSFMSLGYEGKGVNAILGTIAFVLCFVGTNLIIMACNIKNNRNAK